MGEERWVVGFEWGGGGCGVCWLKVLVLVVGLP